MTLNLSANAPAGDWADFERHDIGRTSGRTTQQKRGDDMATTIDSRPRSCSKFKRAESIEFRLIFIAAFAVFLFAAIFERLLPHAWLRRDGTHRKSIIEQAKDGANTCAAYAFMG